MDEIVYLTEIDDDSLGTFIPEKGMHLPVLYNRENPSDAVAAKADWLTVALMPLRDNGEN
ncbi:MAG: hypothetical protein PUE78_02470 [Clostridia bacterium]|nr:hypothetical protein [Clostridia bacterium]